MIDFFNQHIIDVVFWLFCLITIAGALYVLFSNHVLYAAYGLLVCFLGVAGIFVFANADFVSGAQIMIYVGGILVLLVFGIMLSSNKKEGQKYLSVNNSPFTFSLLIVICMSAILVLVSGKLIFMGKPSVSFLPLKDIGFYLMTSYVLILEIIGLLLLMALVGATFIAKDDK